MDPIEAKRQKLAAQLLKKRVREAEEAQENLLQAMEMSRSVDVREMEIPDEDLEVDDADLYNLDDLDDLGLDESVEDLDDADFEESAEVADLDDLDDLEVLQSQYINQEAELQELIDSTPGLSEAAQPSSSPPPAAQPAAPAVGRAAPTPPAPATAGARECPHCAEVIRVRAKICRFCGYDLVAQQAPGVSERIATALGAARGTPEHQLAIANALAAVSATLRDGVRADPEGRKALRAALAGAAFLIGDLLSEDLSA